MGFRIGHFDLRTEERDGEPYYLVVSSTIGSREELYPVKVGDWDGLSKGISFFPDEVVLHEGRDLVAAQAFYDDCWSKVDNKPPEG